MKRSEPSSISGYGRMLSPVGTLPRTRTAIPPVGWIRMPPVRPEPGNPARSELVMTDDSRGMDRNKAPHGIDWGAPAAALEAWIVELLACPVDRGAVRLNQIGLFSTKCDRQYLVVSGIP